MSKTHQTVHGFLYLHSSRKVTSLVWILHSTPPMTSQLITNINLSTTKHIYQISLGFPTGSNSSISGAKKVKTKVTRSESD